MKYLTHKKRLTIFTGLFFTVFFWTSCSYADIFLFKRSDSITIRAIVPSDIDLNTCELNMERECPIDIYGNNFTPRMKLNAQLFFNDRPNDRRDWQYRFINSNHVRANVPLMNRDALVRIAFSSRDHGSSNVYRFKITGFNASVCGDGVITGNELCDDASENGEPNHCNARCSDITPPVCGNGVMESGEQCDDDNNTSGDGCSDTCAEERGDDPDGGSSQGSTVAVLEVQAPTNQEFFLHGTFPLPKQTFCPGMNVEPFKVRQLDGIVVKAQTEVSAWYPDAENDCASSVEIMAKVSRGNAVPGAMIEFPVIFDPSEATNPAGPNADASEILTHGITLPDELSTLLHPGKIKIVTKDVFNNDYHLDLLNGPAERYKEGPVSNQVRTFNLARPIDATNPNVLPNLFGVHAFIQTVKNSDLLVVDLLFSNAQCNLENTTDSSGASNYMLFQHIKMNLPHGWKVYGINDPFFDNTPVAEGSSGYDSFNIISPFSDGTMQVMPKGAHFMRRLVIGKTGKDAESKDILDRYGLGFVKDASDADGNPYWSWWSIGNYYPHMLTLPHLDHLGPTPEAAKANIRQAMITKKDWLENMMTTGQSLQGVSPVPYGTCGWHQGYGQKGTGLNPGGDEIRGFEGGYAAYAASREGITYYDTVKRMRDVRQNNYLFRNDGRPLEKRDVPATCGTPQQESQSLVLDFTTLQPIATDNTEPCYFNSQQATSHYNYALANGLLPACLSDIQNMPVLLTSHMIRWHRTFGPLIYLTNDSLTKFEASEQGYLSEMAKTTSPKINWDNKCVASYGSLYEKRLRVDANPHTGDDISRIDGWTMHNMSMAYHTAQDPVERQKLHYWFDEYTDILSKAQITSNGIFNSRKNTNMPDHLSMLYFHETYVAQGLFTVLQSVYKDSNAEKEEKARQALLLATRTSTLPVYWSMGICNKPYWRIGTAPVSDPANPYAPTNIPLDALDGPCGASDLVIPIEFTNGIVLDQNPGEYLAATETLVGEEDIITAARGYLTLNFENSYNEWVLYLGALEKLFGHN